MGKKTVFTNITPLPPQVSREVAIAMLHNHDEMIELNPLVIEHHAIKTPRDAPADEFLDCAWHEMTDRIQYLPGGLVTGKVSYKGCFHDLPNGLQTHIYAPMGLDIREKWTVAGTLPGEPDEPQELGLNAPRRGLYLREDGEMKCNFLMTGFVRKNLNESHKVLVERILAKAERVQAHLHRVSAATSRDGLSPRMPIFQPGSHMSNSSLVRQMTQTSSPEAGSQRTMPSRTSSESVTIQLVKTPVRPQAVVELPGPSVDDRDKPLPRRPSEDEDDAELVTIHPALREEYRKSRAEGLMRQDTVLPGYHTLQHQKGQFYHDDVAKRPLGTQFAAELAGSAGPSSQPRPPSPPQPLPAPPATDSPVLPSGSYLPSTVYGESRLMEAPRSQHQPPSHAHSQGHGHSQAHLQPNRAGQGTIDRFSVVSGISEMPAVKAGQRGWEAASGTRFSVVSAMTDMAMSKSNPEPEHPGNGNGNFF